MLYAENVYRTAIINFSFCFASPLRQATHLAFLSVSFSSSYWEHNKIPIEDVSFAVFGCRIFSTFHFYYLPSIELSMSFRQYREIAHQHRWLFEKCQRQR